MINEKLIDYDRIVGYAKTLCFSYGVPECDILDIAHSAYITAIFYSWQVKADENEVALANRIMYASVIKEMRQRNIKGNRILRYASEIVVAEGEDEVLEDSQNRRDAVIVHDNGTGAAVIRYTDDWENPYWLRHFRDVSKKLKGREKKLVRLLLKDSRLCLARAKLKLSGRDFGTFLKKIKVRFAPVFIECREWRDNLERPS